MRRRTDPIELTTRRAGYLFVLAATVVLSVLRGQEDARAGLEGEFTQTVRPFLQTYCINCHGQQRPAAQLDLSGFTTMAALMKDGRRWSQMLERLEGGGDAAQRSAATHGAGAARGRRLVPCRPRT